MNLHTLLNNYVLTASILCWLSAQVIKTILVFITSKKFVPERLVGSGGMPSSHSATVCGLAIAVARNDGFNSNQFAISFVLAFVVMYDAMGVRRAAGEQAKRINYLMSKDRGISEGQALKSLRDEYEKEQKAADFDKTNESGEASEEEQLKEFLGHTPVQVLAGALLGIITAMLIPLES